MRSTSGSQLPTAEVAQSLRCPFQSPPRRLAAATYIRRWRTRSLLRADPEDRVVRSDPQQFPVRGIGVNALKEHTDLGPPAPEIGPEDVRLVGIGDLGGAAGIDPEAQTQLALPGRPQAADPLRGAPWRDQVS